jgi:small basic protein
MKLKARDLTATLLVALIAIPYVGFLVAGEMPFVDDPRGMSAVGLLLGSVAYVVLQSGAPLDRTEKVETVLAAVSAILGVVAMVLAETAAAEVLLAVFMGSILLVWAVKVVDHAGYLPVTHHLIGRA